MSTETYSEWLEATRGFWGADSSFDAKYRRICVDPEIEATTDETVLRRLWEKRTEDDLAFLLEGIPLQPDWTCLEIGCGVGRLLEPIAARCSRVVGVDISPEMVAYAEGNLRELSNVELHVNDGRSFPAVADGSVDWVFSHLAFQHMTLPEIVESNVAESARVLKPGGYLRIQTWREAPIPFRQRIKNIVRSFVGVEQYHGPRSWQWAPGRQVRFGGVAYHPHQWRRALRAHGFDVLDLRSGLGHDYWMWCTCRRR